MTERGWLPRVAAGAALIALIAWSCWQRWSALADSAFPVGIDGYYYPIQLRSLLERGALAYGDFPLAFWLMTPFAAATDPIVGAKLAAAFYGALIALPAYGIGARLGHGRGAGLLAAVLATTSAGSMFLTLEFVKNGIGLTLALTAVWLLMRALEVTSPARIGAALAATVAALLTHKMAGGIVVLIAVPALIAHAVGRGVLRGRRLMYVVAAVGLVAVAGLGLGLATSERYATLLAGLRTSTPRWEAPALAVGNAYLPMGREAVIGGGLALLAAITLYRPLQRAFARRAARPADPGLQPQLAPTIMTTPEKAIAATMILLALATALPWLAVDDPQGLGFRLRVAAFLPMALCGAMVARALHLPLALALGAVPSHRIPAVREAVLAAIAAAILLAVPAQRVEGRIIAHPAMVAAIQALGGRVPPDHVMIVPERHVMFMVAWYTRQPTRLRPETVPSAHRWRVMPLAFIGARSPLDDALLAARREPALTAPVGTHPRHPNGLVLVHEPTWQWVLARLPPRLRDHYTRWPTI